MSVLIVVKFQGDTEAFRRALTERSDEFVKIAESGRGMGCIHHRFGVSDGVVMVVDEWQSAEQFQRFFSDPSLQEFISTVGAAPAPPDITVTEAVASPDQY